MGNKYNVIESGVIQCACGGKVTLTSTAKVERIAGKKPLYLTDIIGAPVDCPRSKNPCTKVASVSTAGTETNVKSTSKNFLLRTDGFKTDKGRAVVLVNPGQGTSQISSPPSIESSVVKEEEPLEEAIKQEEEIKQTEKYSLYLVRKSEDIYRPLRPTRAFLKSDDTYVGKKEFVQIKDNVHVHTFAYVYIIQNDKIQEYKVLSRGTLYSEKLQEIFFENTQTKIKYNYIPLYDDTQTTISYSSIKLTNKTDILKLKRQIIDPKQPDNRNSFYFKDSNSINKIVLTEDDLKTEKKYKVNEEDKNKRLNILCIIEDILAQIEDMYERYYTNYKLAYAYNNSIIEDIKSKNNYTYTIANMVDYFYFSKKESASYKKTILELKKIYNEIVSFILTDSEFITLLKNYKDLSQIIEKDDKKVGQSYFQQIQFLKKDFFSKELDDEEKSKTLGDVYYSKTNFKTSGKNLSTRYIYLTNSIKKTNRRYIANLPRMGFKQFTFNSNNDDFTKIKDNASYVLANTIFSLLYSEKFEDELKLKKQYSKLNSLRSDFFLKLRQVVPKPNINDDSIEDIQDIVESQTVYHDMMVKPINFRDKFLQEFEDLDYTKRIKSFEQKGDNTKFSSKYLYYDNLIYFKDKSIETPEKILVKIEKQLQDIKLKELLKIYENINIEDNLSYVISCMNIVYLLSAPRVFLDEESDKTSFFNESLNHIYEFVVNLTKKRIALEDNDKDIINKQYQIAKSYSYMQTRLILNDIIFSNSSKKAINFLNTFKIKIDEDAKEDSKYKYINDSDQNIKSLSREYFETLKNIEGVTSSFQSVLEKIENNLPERFEISKEYVKHLNVGLKSYSTFIAIANISDYLFFDDSKKNIKNHIGFVKDLTDVTVNIGLLISKYPKTPMHMLELFFKESATKEISNSSKRLLSSLEKKVVTKVAVLTVIITTTYDVVRLYQREDYDALAVTLCIGSFNLAIIIASPSLPVLIVVVLLQISMGFILNEFLDSDLDLYLKKSILYKTVDFSLWKNLRGIPQNKMYQAPYLFEITNKNEKLKAINSDGFNKPKKLINFIGENYKENKEYFDAALRNELSFFKSSLFGYKLELLNETKRVKKLKNKYDIDIVLNERTYIKIPKQLVENKKNKFIFVSDGIYVGIEQNNFVLEDKYYIYDLYNQDFAYLKELAQLNNKKASIILFSPQIELKYDFIYDYKDINYLFALNFKQSSFTLKDIEELEKLKEKKD